MPTRLDIMFTKKSNFETRKPIKPTAPTLSESQLNPGPTAQSSSSPQAFSDELELNSLARDCERLFHKTVNTIYDSNLLASTQHDSVTWLNQELRSAALFIIQRVVAAEEAERPRKECRDARKARKQAESENLNVMFGKEKAVELRREWRVIREEERERRRRGEVEDKDKEQLELLLVGMDKKGNKLLFF